MFAVINNTFRTILLVLALANVSLAGDLPACLPSSPQAGTEAVIAAGGIPEGELLARLAYAEGLSTGFPDEQTVYEAIAWGVMNRVRLGEASPGMRRAYGQGVYGVIFKKGQFNPAVSKRSPFSKAFLCPDHARRWQMARGGAEKALTGKDNPFLQTPWERHNALSLVVNFYYPRSVQAKGTLAPWEGNPSLGFIGDVSITGRLLPSGMIRFYRLNHPPADIKK